MNKLVIPYNSNVIVGSESKDDAGVYRVNDTLALVQTLDFITPVCDEPFTFGRIAAANSLSDVYAMGGTPVTAMNIIAFPTEKFSLSIMQQILEGGIDVLKEAGVQLLGGHSVEDNELKYGLSVTGYVHPEKVIKNNTIKDKDILILTKPLGTGIISTALKADFADKSILDEFLESMSTLNKNAAEIMIKYNVSACTDVTGFGLAGHLLEMTGDSKFTALIDSGSLPVLEGALENAAMGLIPGGLYRNRDYIGNRCFVEDSVPREMADIIYDPQTSGGLIIAIPEMEADLLLKAITDSGNRWARVIGRVETLDKPGIVVR